MRDHINSIPRIEHHYGRERSTREYIDGEVSIAEIHRNYREYREKMGKPAAKSDKYADIFETEFNISLFTPKKDQCHICVRYENAEGPDKEKLQSEYDRHQEEKKLSRAERVKYKEEAKNNDSLLAVYDLEAVMPVPTGFSSTFFYKSKLNCLNFTVST